MNNQNKKKFFFPIIQHGLSIINAWGFIFFILFFSNRLNAQHETIISGRITESKTNSGIPFANIYFKGTLVGTVTDFEGNYSIKTTSPKDSIYVSLLGYQSKAKGVKKGKVQVIDFQLNPETLDLNVVVVRPGINPAIRIIQNAMNNKEKYNRENLQSVQYLSYTKQETDIDNVTNRMRKLRLLHSLTKMWDKLDSIAGEESRANLPVAMSEIISEVYSSKEGEKKHEDVNAIKIKFVGMKDGSALSQLQGTDFQTYNFCKNNVTITVIGKDFLSPIANNGFLFYNYYLLDSIVIDGLKCYQINCNPKNKKDLAFTGSLWITDSTFVIKQLDLEITNDVNLNLVDHIRLQQIMIPTDAGPWVPSQTRVLIDFSTQVKNFVSLAQRTYNSNKYFIVNKPKEIDFYKTRITYAEDAITKDSVWWLTNRHEPLTKIEGQSYNVIDTVRNIRFIKFAVNNLYFLFSGYKDIGPIDFGHYLGLYGYNKYEGSRAQLGFKTNAKFSKNWIVKGYGAYGFKDQGFKYNLQLERIISRYPWSTAGIQYRNDIDQIGTNFSYMSNMNLGQSSNNLYSLFSHIGNISKLVRQQEFRLWYVRSFNNGVSGTLTFQNIKTSPLFPVYYGNDFNIFQQRNYSRTEFLFEGRYAANEKYIQNGNDRIRLGNKKSIVIDFLYTLGIKHLLNGDFNYNKVSISISNRFKMATLGYSNIYVKVGKVFSEVPYTLLEIPRGNQTGIYANNTFNQMNYFEFVSDQYIEAYWQHHFDGLLFNRIPFIKKFNFREVLGINMAYGTLSDKNKKYNINNNFTVMDKVPYFEGDLGIENILDIIRIDFLYRLTYNDVAYKDNYLNANAENSINNWGIKVGLQFSF